MNKIAALDRAVDLVKTALAAGWCREETGEALGRQVAEAIEIVADRLVEISSK